MSKQIVVVSGGLSQPSTSRMLADRLGNAAREQLGELGATAELDTVELRELAREITDAALTGFAAGRLQQVLTAIEESDALIAVSPIFKASYTGLFKSFVDVIDADALIGRPVLLGATGGTVRHSLALDHALRPLFSYMQALVVPTGVFASPGDWGSETHGSEALAARVNRAGAELANLVTGSDTGRHRDDDFDMYTATMLAAARP